MRSFLAWTIAGAAAPMAYGLAFLVLMVIGQGADSLVVNIGTVMLMAMMTALPGAALGALTGLVDLYLRSRVARVEREVRRGKAAGAAAVILVLIAGYLLAMMGLTPSNWSNVLYNVIVSVTLALVPASVAYVLYVRLPSK